jgi:hypothetical protein
MHPKVLKLKSCLEKPLHDLHLYTRRDNITMVSTAPMMMINGTITAATMGPAQEPGEKRICSRYMYM